MAEPAPLFEAPRAPPQPDAGPFQGWRIVLVAAACHALGFGLIGVLAFATSLKTHVPAILHVHLEQQPPFIQVHGANGDGTSPTGE